MLPAEFLSPFLLELGDKRKTGVGRKISYEFGFEEKILEYALAERENDSGLTFKMLKDKALEILGQSKPTKNTFKASHSWAKKFCKRNNLEVGTVWWAPPKAFPK